MGDIPETFAHLADSSADIQGHGIKEGVVRPLSKKKVTNDFYNTAQHSSQPSPIHSSQSTPQQSSQLSTISPYLRVLISPHHICQK